MCSSRGVPPFLQEKKVPCTATVNMALSPEDVMGMIDAYVEDTKVRTSPYRLVTRCAVTKSNHAFYQVAHAAADQDDYILFQPVNMAGAPRGVHWRLVIWDVRVQEIVFWDAMGYEFDAPGDARFLSYLGKRFPSFSLRHVYCWIQASDDGYNCGPLNAWGASHYLDWVLATGRHENAKHFFAPQSTGKEWPLWPKGAVPQPSNATLVWLMPHADSSMHQHNHVAARQLRTDLLVLAKDKQGRA